LSPDEVIAYAEKVILLARDQGKRGKELEGIYQTAAGYYYKGEFYVAKAKLAEIEASGFYADSPKYLGDVYKLQGLIFKELSDYKTALSYYFKGLELTSETSDMDREMIILNIMGEVYAYHLDVENGRGYYR
jgi:tetratricopeptide (TPR) repeat protein